MAREREIQPFRQVCEMLPDCIKERLVYLDSLTQSLTQEIRLRTGRPIQLSLGEGKGERFVSRQGKAEESPGLVRRRRCQSGRGISDLPGHLRLLHPHPPARAAGRLCLYERRPPGGHLRYGGDGKGTDSGRPRYLLYQYPAGPPDPGGGSASPAGKLAAGGKRHSSGGPPTSGKTTMIRDMARILSSGFQGRYYKVTVIDERGEIAACSGGQPQNDIGLCCDVLDGYEKGEGMMMALKTLGPEVLICDELGSNREIQAVTAALNCGVRVIATIHAGSAEEVYRRTSLSALLDTGAFDQLVLLYGRERAGEIRQVVPLKETANLR